MGREVAKYLDASGAGDRIVAGVDPTARDFPYPTVTSFSCAERSDEFSLAAKSADVIIDFSNRAATRDVLAYALKHRLPAVVATTGQTDGDNALIGRASLEIPVFVSANMSTGVALLTEIAGIVAAAMPESEIEIIETHHDKKEDAPSGTALMLADAVSAHRSGTQTVFGRHGRGARGASEIGIHSVRVGGEIGTHEIIFGSYNQTITVRHEAHSRAMYADGAVRAARFLLSRSAGLYSMKDMLNEESE